MIQSNYSESVKKSQANFLISVRILSDLKDHIPARHRSQFVEQAIEKALNKEQFLKAIHESAGAWKAKDHKTPTDKFIRSLRESKRI